MVTLVYYRLWRKINKVWLPFCRIDSFEEMGKVNNVWTVANNIILLFVLCSTMALYAPIVKAIWKAKKVSQEKCSRAASFRLFYSQHDTNKKSLNSKSVYKSKSDSNIKASAGKETSGWKLPLKKRCQEPTYNIIQHFLQTYR